MSGFTNENTKENRSISSSLAFIVFFILYCESSTNYNLPVYEWDYDTLSAPSIKDISEWLYYSFKVWGNALNISFKYFHFILTSASILILQSVVRKWIGNYSLLFYLLFFIFPAGSALSAFRDGISMCLLTLAFPLLSTYKKKNFVIYAIIIFIASAIHRSFVIYYLLIGVALFDHLLPSVRKSRMVKLYGVFIIGCFALAFMPSLLRSVLTPVVEFISDGEKIGEESLGYFNSMANMGFLLFGGFQLICIYVLYKMRLNSQEYLMNDSETDNFTRIVLYCDFFLLFLVIGYKLDSNFFRIFWNILPVNYMSVIMLYKKYNNNRNKWLFIAFFCFVWFFGLRFGNPMFRENYYPMFNDNWILKLDF